MWKNYFYKLYMKIQLNLLAVNDTTLPTDLQSQNHGVECKEGIKKKNMLLQLEFGSVWEKG